MRNRLIHGYDVIDYDLLWDTVTSDLPELFAENVVMKSKVYPVFSGSNGDSFSLNDAEER
jgi:hypothetical protein